MHADLALRDGVLYVLEVGPRARLALYDLDGRRLGGGFEFDGRSGPRARPAALAVDADRRLWLADPEAGCVRGCTLFGRESLRLGPDPERAAELSELERRADRAGVLGSPVAIDVEGSSDGLRLLVGSSGRRRHGLHLFDGEGALVRSLRPRGESHGRFTGIAGVDLAGRFALACEPRRGWIQVWRDLDFHALVALPERAGERPEPRAVRRLEDGRLVVAFGGPRSGVALLSRDGAFERLLADDGRAEGAVFEPTGLVVEPGRTEALTRVVVVDADGERLQVLSLDGHALGSIDLATPAPPGGAGS